MRILDVLKRMLVLDIPSHYKVEFQRDNNKIIMNKGRVIAFTIIGIEILLIIFKFTEPNALIYPDVCYIAMYVIIATAMIVYLVIYYKVSKYAIQERTYNVIILFFSSFILLWSAGLSIIDQVAYGQVTAYIITSLSIAVFTHLKPTTSILMYVSCQILFVIFLPKVQMSESVLIGNIINTNVLTILAILVARMQYKKRVVDFINNKTIEEKNEAFKIVNNKLQAANEKLEKLSLTDSLTALNNRRSFNQQIAYEWERSKRFRLSLSVIYIDIDFFKAYNDRYGHVAGDHCLIQIAKVLETFSRRSTDFVARFGGEEFVVLHLNLRKKEIIEIAEKLRREVEELQIVHGVSPISPYVTISLGVNTVIPSDHNSIESLIEGADKALYIAKQNNRNQVVTYHEDEKK